MMRLLLCAWSTRYVPAWQREWEREIERWNKAERGPLRRNERKMSLRKDGLVHLQDEQMDRRRKWNEEEKERGGNNAKHKWVPDRKENRQIRAGRMWKRIRLTHWRRGLERSTASAHWRSYRISNPEQRPSLPSKCVVWLSSDHPHAGYGNLRDGKRRERYLWFVFAAYGSLSAAWALFFQTNLIYDSISIPPAQAMNQISSDVRKNMHAWTEDFLYIDFNQAILSL